MDASLHKARVHSYNNGNTSVNVSYFCRAAFFRGQIEHPSKKLRLMSMTDDPVFVAINTEGVFIIDLDDVVSTLFY